jgi:membrane protein implicated in regulation of membrane protease activity
MSEIIGAVVWAVAIGIAIYSLLEAWEIRGLVKHSPRHPVSGMESLIGRSAIVSQPFEHSQARQPPSGQVTIDGESWRAELQNRPGEFPDLGEKVTICAVEPSKLTVIVN